MFTKMMVVTSKWTTARIVLRALRFKAISSTLAVGSGLALAYVISIPCPRPIGECAERRDLGASFIFVFLVCTVIVAFGTVSYVSHGLMRRTALRILEHKLVPLKWQYLQIFPSACAGCCSRNLEASYSVDYGSIVGFPDSSNRYTTYTTYTCGECGTVRKERDGYGENYDLALSNAPPQAYLASSSYLTEDENKRFPSYSSCIRQQPTMTLAKNS